MTATAVAPLRRLTRKFRFELPPTATYKQRACEWFAGLGSGDGMVTITIVHAKSYRLEQDAYGLDEQPAERPGTRRFLVEPVATEHEVPPAPYVVTTGAFRSCTCECGTKGYRRAECKHIHAVEFLIQCGKLPVRELQGA